ncbi:MAG: prephenate dehydrogenase [Chloroflexota bacterium]|nr:prephenate dehydrogenase [Chloroflexota bacterium]
MKHLDKAQITVVGLGLMGGSLAGALRGTCRSVVGVARRREAISNALGRGLIDRGTTRPADGVAQADVVVLATPVRVILQQIRELGPLLPQDCLLMDLGSTKTEIVAEMARLPERIQPLGGHPMCGKETSGLEAAEPTLYQDATFILTPLPRTSERALALGRELARAVGSRPLVVGAERQDFLVGTVSHLPYLMACALVATADATTSADPAAWEIVAGGYRDTTRVAGSNVTMMTDILLTNRQEVLKALDVFQGQIAKLSQLVESGNQDHLRTVLAEIREKRLEMYP